MKKEKFVIKDILTNKKKLDRRYYLVQRFKQFLAAFVLGSILGALLGCYLADGGSISIGSPEVLEQTIEVKGVKVAEAQERPFCNNVINCIRDVGEELGRDNKTIMTMIRIAKCESGYRAEAINVNTNRTIDRGVFQVNSIHKALSNKDAFDYESNIRFAYQLQGKQNFTPWNASKRCWSI